VKRTAIAAAVATSLLFFVLAECSQAQQPTAIGGTSVRQSDNELFGQALWDIEKSKYAEARSLLQSLIQNYPDSDFVPRAKLSIGDAWYAEGKLAQAKAEYQDFVAFFPQRPEVVDAQLKINSIQWRSK
jgi:outer membrane assembly lipoprotein YfiO